MFSKAMLRTTQSRKFGSYVLNNKNITRKLPIKDQSLKEHDPELYHYIECEKARQFGGIELIASENFAYTFVMDAMGSCLTNKYSEGYPGGRYYGGNEFIDKIENLCRDRAL
jgi:glycine hydroxymethyltransferase